MYNTLMSKTPKLAIFDIDGTIAVKGEIPPVILEGFHHLHDLGCVTTVSTGRGYVRLKELLGDLFDTIISPEAPVIIEHGTKIVHRDGKLIFGEFFSEHEIDHVADFTRANIGLFKLAWFNPLDITQKVQVWCADERDVAEETAKRGHYADVFSSSIGDLEERLLAQRLTNVTLRLKDYVKVENLKLAFTRTETFVIFQDGNMEFVKANTNKGLAVLYAAKKLRLKAQDVLVAGNAINDIEMLDLGVGTAILVGQGKVRATILAYLSSPQEIITVDTPEDLGKYLIAL